MQDQHHWQLLKCHRLPSIYFLIGFITCDTFELILVDKIFEGFFHRYGFLKFGENETIELNAGSVEWCCAGDGSASIPRYLIVTWKMVAWHRSMWQSPLFVAAIAAHRERYRWLVSVQSQPIELWRLCCECRSAVKHNQIDRSNTIAKRNII